MGLAFADTRFEVLLFIAGQVEQLGFPPTVREICSHFGWSGTNAATHHLKRLQSDGYLKRMSGARAMSLTPEGRAFCRGLRAA